MSQTSSKEDDYKRIKWNGWGGNDRRMVLDPDDPTVVIHPTGKRMRDLTLFIAKEVGGDHSGTRAKLTPTPSISMEEALQKLPPPILNAEFLAGIQKLVAPNQIRLDPESRLTHVMGKNYRDLWRLRKAQIIRAPDVILLPESHEDCIAIMDLASRHNVVIIPYGGGTNVVGGVEPNPFETRRMVASIDLRRMNKMISIDKESRIAVFQVGVTGPQLDEQLGRHGFMCGHDPDSFIYSTLGGWIAARSSGAYSNRYGDIESIVLSLKLVTPKGVISTPVSSRQCGLDMSGLFIGSEGIFGIITEATIKCEPIPAVRHYEGWLLPTFEAGFAAIYKVTALGVQPCAMRLYDEDDMRMSMALRFEEPMVKKILARGVRQYLQTVRGFDMNKLSLCIMGYEGIAETTAAERKIVTKIFGEANGFCVGAAAGANWQEKKYDLPYVRDFALGHGYWADVFETTVLYSNAIALWRDVKTAVRNVWKAEGKKGWIGCHSAHQYKHGTCLYFSYAGQQFDDADMVTFLKIKRAATEAMLQRHGNLTHHHGIGYEHVPWIHQQYGALGMSLLHRVKAELDPQDICNPGKVLPPQRKPKETDQQYEERCQKTLMFDKMGLPPRLSKL